MADSRAVITIDLIVKGLRGIQGLVNLLTRLGRNKNVAATLKFIRRAMALLGQAALNTFRQIKLFFNVFKRITQLKAFKKVIQLIIRLLMILRTQLSQAGKGLTGMAIKADFARAKFAQMSSTLRSFSFVIRDVGRSFRNMAFIILGALAAIIFKGSQVNQSFADLRAILNNTPVAQFDDLAKSIVDVGKATSFTIGEVAELATELAKAGFTAQEIKDSIGGVVQLAEVGGLDPAAAAGVAANILRTFGLAASEIGRVNDVLASTATRTNTTVAELAESFKFVGPIAASLNKSLEETAATLGVLANRGLKSSVAGAGLAQVFVQLTKRQDKANEVLAKYGKTFADVNPVIRSTVEILRAFEDANFSTLDATELFGARALKIFLALRLAGSDVIETMTKLNQASEGLAATIQKIKLDTLSGDVKLLLSALSALNLNIFSSIADEIRNIVKIITHVVGSVENWVAANKQLAATLFKTGAIAAGFLLTASAALMGFGTIFASVAILIFAGVEVIQGALVAVIAIMALMAIAAVPLTAIGFGIVKSIKRISAAFKEILNDVIQPFVLKVIAAFGTFSGKFDVVFNEMSLSIKIFLKALRDAANELSKVFSPEDIGNAIGNISVGIIKLTAIFIRLTAVVVRLIPPLLKLSSILLNIATFGQSNFYANFIGGILSTPSGELEDAAEAAAELKSETDEVIAAFRKFGDLKFNYLDDLEKTVTLLAGVSTLSKDQGLDLAELLKTTNLSTVSDQVETELERVENMLAFLNNQKEKVDESSFFGSAQGTQLRGDIKNLELIKSGLVSAQDEARIFQQLLSEDTKTDRDAEIKSQLEGLVAELGILQAKAKHLQQTGRQVELAKALEEAAQKQVKIDKLIAETLLRSKFTQEEVNQLKNDQFDISARIANQAMSAVADAEEAAEIQEKIKAIEEDKAELTKELNERGLSSAINRSNAELALIEEKLAAIEVLRKSERILNLMGKERADQTLKEAAEVEKLLKIKKKLITSDKAEDVEDELLKTRLEVAKAVGDKEAEIRLFRESEEKRIATEKLAKFKEDAKAGAEFEKLQRIKLEKDIENLQEKKKVKRSVKDVGKSVEEDIARSLKDQVKSTADLLALNKALLAIQFRKEQRAIQAVRTAANAARAIRNAQRQIDAKDAAGGDTTRLRERLELLKQERDLKEGFADKRAADAGVDRAVEFDPVGPLAKGGMAIKDRLADIAGFIGDSFALVNQTFLTAPVLWVDSFLKSWDENAPKIFDKLAEFKGAIDGPNGAPAGKFNPTPDINPSLGPKFTGIGNINGRSSSNVLTDNRVVTFNVDSSVDVNDLMIKFGETLREGGFPV